jgi:hypothetical protein
VAMISRGRATHYPTLTVKITDRYKAADGLAQPHREPSTHLPQIDRLGRTVRRGKRNVNYLNESSTVRALCSYSCTTGTRRSFAPARRKDVVRERDRTCHAYGQWLFARFRKHHEKFGTAEARRGVPALGCCAFAALNEAVSPSEIAKVSRQVSWLRYLARREKADLRQSRSCSDCSSCRAGWIGA